MNLIKRKNNWIDPFDFFEDFERSLAKRAWRDFETAAFSPQLDLVEEGDHYKAHLDLPGLKKEDLDISITDRVLSIKGERKEQSEKEEKGYYHSERRFGTFSRLIELPSEVDEGGVKAAYKDGVLDITIPKSPKAKPKQVNVDVK